MRKSKNKITKKDRLASLSYELEGSFDKVIETIKATKEYYLKTYSKYSDFKIEYTNKEWVEGYELAVFGIREETEEEEKLRIEEEQRRKELTEQYEKKQYEALKKKFEL